MKPSEPLARGLWVQRAAFALAEKHMPRLLASEAGSPDWLAALQDLAYRAVSTGRHQTLDRIRRDARELKRPKLERRPKMEWHVALKEAISVCFYCERPTPRGERTVDHVMPLILGGADRPENAVMACYRCNHLKNAKGLMKMLELAVKAERRQAILDRLAWWTGLTIAELRGAMR